MKIRKVELTNFMNISHAIVNFTDGINVLSGAMGSGKSAILEAIAFPLLDLTRGPSWKDYIKRGSKGFEIDLDVETDSNEIMNFHFVGKKSSSTCEKVVTYREETAVNSDTKIMIGNAFDLDMLEKVVFNMQSNPPISEMTPAVRRAIFKKIFNSDFSHVISTIKLDQQTIVTSNNLLESEIRLLTTKSYTIHDVEEIDYTLFESLHQEYKDAQLASIEEERYAIYSSRLKELANKVTTKDTQVASLNRLIASKGQSEEEVNKIAKVIEQETENLKLLEKQFTALKQEEVIEADQLKLVKEKVLSIKKDNLAHSYAQEQEKLQTDEIQKRTELSIVKKHLETHRKGICDSCGSTCEPTKIEQFEEDILTIERSLSFVSKKIQTIKASIQEDILSLKQAEDAETAQRRKADSKVLEIEKKLNEIASKKSSIDNSSKRKEDLVSKTLVNTLTQITEQEERIADLEREVADLSVWCQNNKVENVNSDKRSLVRIQADIDAIKSQIATNKEKERVNALTEQEMLKDKEKISALNLKLNQAKEELSSLDAVIKIFDVEFPGYINLRACSILENYMNAFFASIASHFKVKIDLDAKGVNLFYTSDGSEDWGALKMTSGGEGMLVTLGFNVATAHAFGSKLLVLDEPDKANDPESGTRLFEAINSISGFDQLIIISHKPTAMDFFMENGANVYKVNKGQFERVIE